MSHFFKKLMLYALVVSCGSTGLLQADNGSRFGTLFRHANNYANNATEWVKKNKVAAYALGGLTLTTGLWLNARNNFIKADQRHKADKERSEKSLNKQYAVKDMAWREKLAAADKEKAEKEAALDRAKGAITCLTDKIALLRKQHEQAMSEKEAQLLADYVRYVEVLNEDKQMLQHAKETFQKTIDAMTATNQRELETIYNKRKAVVQRNWRFLAHRLGIAQARSANVMTLKWHSTVYQEQVRVGKEDRKKLMQTISQYASEASKMFETQDAEHKGVLAEQAAQHERTSAAQTKELEKKDRRIRDLEATNAKLDSAAESLRLENEALKKNAERVQAQKKIAMASQNHNKRLSDTLGVAQVNLQIVEASVLELTEELNALKAHKTEEKARYEMEWDRGLNKFQKFLNEDNVERSAEL